MPSDNSDPGRPALEWKNPLGGIPKGLMDSQVELGFEEARSVWERMVRESSMLFAHFEAYRKLGPARTLIAVYREHLNGGPASKLRELPLIPRDDAVTVPSAWKKWARRWRWKERAEAWDAWMSAQHGAIERQAAEERFRERLEQRLQLDRIDYDHITKIKELIGKRLSEGDMTGALIREEKPLYDASGHPAGTRTVQVDKEKVVATLSKIGQSLEDRYFAPLAGAAQEENATVGAISAAAVGEFRWVRDPELAEPEAPHDDGNGNGEGAK